MKKLTKTLLNLLYFGCVKITASLQFLHRHFVLPILFFYYTHWFYYPFLTYFRICPWPLQLWPFSWIFCWAFSLPFFRTYQNKMKSNEKTNNLKRYFWSVTKSKKQNMLIFCQLWWSFFSCLSFFQNMVRILCQNTL